MILRRCKLRLQMFTLMSCVERFAVIEDLALLRLLKTNNGWHDYFSNRAPPDISFISSFLYIKAISRFNIFNQFSTFSHQ